MPNEKKPQEFGNFLEFQDQMKVDLPKIVGFVSQDNFEFEQLVEFYRDKLRHSDEAFEGIVYTGEGGEIDSFFSHLFTPDMFFPTKLIIVKSGSVFFKPFLAGTGNKSNELFLNFVHQLPQMSDRVYLLFHYDHWEMPAKIKKLFENDLSLIVSKNFYPNQTRQNLERILRQEDLSMTGEAIDEFLHRIPPNLGSYLKNVHKLRVYTNKKKFELTDVQDILFSRNTTNYQEIAGYFYQYRRSEFFREIDKISDIKAELGIILSKLLDRLNELRIYKIYHKRFQGVIPEEDLFQSLGMQSFSSGRKYHIKKELSTESRYLKDKSMEMIYNSLVDMNIKHKFNADSMELKIYIKQKFLNLFAAMEK